MPIIPSENDLGMYYEDKMFIATFFHFLLDRFSIFYEYSQTHFDHQKGGNHFVNQIAQSNS